MLKPGLRGGVGKVLAQSVKCLLCKKEDLSLDPSIYIERKLQFGSWNLILVDRQRDPWG